MFKLIIVAIIVAAVLAEEPTPAPQPIIHDFTAHVSYGNEQTEGDKANDNYHELLLMTAFFRKYKGCYAGCNERFSHYFDDQMDPFFHEDAGQRCRLQYHNCFQGCISSIGASKEVCDGLYVSGDTNFIESTFDRLKRQAVKEHKEPW